MILLGITLVLAIVTTCVLPALAGLQEGLDAFLRGDHKVAIEEWRPLAEQGDDVAQFNMGAVYDQGQGVKRDPIEALRWYKLSAAQGNTHAQTNMGLMYAEGQGIPQDYSEAFRWTLLAAEKGDAQAQLNLCLMHMTGKSLCNQRMLRPKSSIDYPKTALMKTFLHS